MIRMDIGTFVFFYILLSVVVLFILWVLFGHRNIENTQPREMDSIWKCSVCFNNYVDSRHSDISICPLCGSYNKREKTEVNI